jgi:Cu(I)/Ag(I) efflux system membrane fusion protein
LEQSGQQSEELIVTGKGGAQWIYADIYESELGYIKPGLAAEVSANFLQGKVLPAKVLSLDQVINTATRTAKVRLKLLSKNDTVRAESYVNVTVLTPMGEHLVVPEEAIMDTGREQFVYVKKADGVFVPHKVTVLIETDTDAAIGSGVREGDEVVVGANFMLDSESRLKAVISEAK